MSCSSILLYWELVFKVNSQMFSLRPAWELNVQMLCYNHSVSMNVSTTVIWWFYVGGFR